MTAVAAAILSAWNLGAPARADAPKAYPDYNTAPQPPDASGMGETAADIAAHMQLGWNIGNALEATGGETAWGNPRIGKALIDLVKASGFDAVRLPTAWSEHADARTARIDPAWIARVREVVQACVDDDLYVVLNVHWDGGWLENNVTPAKADDVAARQRALWQQIAAAFRDFDEHLIFASANEPNVDSAEQMQVLMRYHQVFVDAVRASGGRNAYRVLAVQGPSTDIDKTDRLMNALPADPAPNRLLLEVHYYTPYNFTGLDRDQSWGRQFFYWGRDFHSRADPDRNASWGEEDAADALFARLKHKADALGVPVIIGEFGAMRRDTLRGDALTLHRASRAHYLEYVAHLAAANGMVPFFWDNGAGVFDRGRNAVSDAQALEALRAGAGVR